MTAPVNFLLEQLLPGLYGQTLGSKLATLDFSGVTTVNLPAQTNINGVAVAGLASITSTAAAAFTVGTNGATGPVLQVDDSTASAVSGVKVKGATATGTVAVTTISTGSNVGLSIDALGTGKLALNKTNNTDVQIGGATGQADIQVAEVTGATGATATLVTVGAAAGGPTTAAQDGWMKVKIAGVQVWVPVWK